jgi:hypothetical protein
MHTCTVPYGSVHSPQLLARGTCIDGTACTGASSCGAWGGTGKGPDDAWAGPYYSSAIAAFSTAGSVTVLLRVSNPNGCGAGAKPDCFGGGSVQYRLDTRESCTGSQHSLHFL